MAEQRDTRVRAELEDLKTVIDSLHGRIDALYQGSRFAHNHTRMRQLSKRHRAAQKLLEKSLEILEESPDAPVFKSRLKSLTSRLMADLTSAVDATDDVEAESEPQREHGERRGRLSGNSNGVSIPDLLAFLEVQGKSGELRVILRDEVVTLEFENGFLIHAFSDNSPPEQRLGEILIAQGAIDRASLDEYLNADSPYLGLIGELLHRGEMVTREQLHAAIDAQIQQLFHRLFQADNATFEFVDGTPNTSREVVQLNITRLLLESARIQDESRSA